MLIKTNKNRLKHRFLFKHAFLFSHILKQKESIYLYTLSFCIFRRKEKVSRNRRIGACAKGERRDIPAQKIFINRDLKNGHRSAGGFPENMHEIGSHIILKISFLFEIRMSFGQEVAILAGKIVSLHT